MTDLSTVDLSGLPAETARALGKLMAELIADAEACGYAQAIGDDIAELRDRGEFYAWARSQPGGRDAIPLITEVAAFAADYLEQRAKERAKERAKTADPWTPGNRCVSCLSEVSQRRRPPRPTGAAHEATATMMPSLWRLLRRSQPKPADLSPYPNQWVAVKGGVVIAPERRGHRRWLLRQRAAPHRDLTDIERHVLAQRSHGTS